MNEYYSGLATIFLNNLFQEISEKKIDLKFIEIDHLCFRTDTEEDYLKVCSDFSAMGELLIEAPVGGRMISTYKFHAPFQYKDIVIPLIEIPAPKASKKTQRGFEHIECVVTDSFEDLIKKYSHLKLVTGALSKELNPELEIELETGAIKFHHQSLEKVIEIEKLQM